MFHLEREWQVRVSPIGNSALHMLKKTANYPELIVTV